MAYNPRVSTITQMFERRLNPVKGWPNPYALDKFAETTAGQGIKAGMVCHLDSNKKFARGLGGNNMPIWMWNSDTDFDTSGVDAGNFNLVGTGKGLSGLVGVGPYEFQTTEFVTSEVYAPNTPLTVEEDVADDVGKVKPGNYYQDPIVGIVSDGQLINSHAVAVVQCWAYYLPAISSTDISSLSSYDK